jgi:hypothetical protein
MINVSGRSTYHEEESVHRRADCARVGAGGVGHESRRALPIYLVTNVDILTQSTAPLLFRRV